MPQCKPVLATIVIFSFTGFWSDFVGPSIYLTKPDLYTLSIGLQLFRSTQSTMPWNLVMAACLLFSIPMVVVLFAAQNAFTKGIVMSGIKG
jgi:multiple sugar transport system permease protein